MKPGFCYRVAAVVSVYDGDTVTLRVDLGFGVQVVETFRLLGIDAPELRAKSRLERLAAADARDWLIGKIARDVEKLTVRSEKGRKEKYGRYLAELWIDGEKTSVNAQMVESQHAVAYDGGKRG